MNEEHDRSPSEPTVATKQDNPWLETLQTIGFSVILALGIRTFVADSRFIPSGSMLPTLQIDDRLIIDKISYRFSTPRRGDIVVFNPTAELEKELQANGEPKYKEAFIKRIIGLPGDRVDVKGGKVYINRQLLPENYLGEPPKYNWSSTELTPDGIVPPDNYLVLGDNRNNSYDGHYWGFLPKEQIIGKAIVRFWPINRVGGIPPQPEYTK
jgi:signal peptidase I